MIGRTLYDVTQLLGSGEDADQRVRRALELLGDLVPYQQCAMLEARLGREPYFVLVPDPSPEERLGLIRSLVDVFGQFVDPEARARGVPARSNETRLVVPLVGLDEVIGLLLVQSSVTTYSEEHLCLLSVIAAKLAAYITMRGASADLAAIAGERDEARRAAQVAHSAKDELLELVSTELKAPVRGIDDVALEELGSKILAQSQRLEDLLGQAHIASAEVRLALLKVGRALLREEPPSPDGWTPRRHLG